VVIPSSATVCLQEMSASEPPPRRAGCKLLPPTICDRHCPDIIVPRGIDTDAVPRRRHDVGSVSGKNRGVIVAATLLNTGHRTYQIVVFSPPLRGGVDGKRPNGQPSVDTFCVAVSSMSRIPVTQS
jgi:hypothetical protein